MSRVRAYLSECLLWAVRKTQLEIPIHRDGWASEASWIKRAPVGRYTPPLAPARQHLPGNSIGAVFSPARCRLSETYFTAVPEPRL
jgi:hypothetical protein